jgi:type I restriction enzyme R subunit
LIQRCIVIDGKLSIVDNIPLAKARELFEQGVKSTQDPLVAKLKRKAWEDKDYEPTEEELAAIKAWIASPDIILSEEQLQRVYEFPGGSVWDFFLDVLGVRKIPTTRDRIETGFETYVALYNFTPEQTAILGRIKDAFVANLSSHGRVDLDAILANPIYARLIGSFDQINAQFDGRLREVVGDMQACFKSAA